ncbi:semaphorin-7A [Paramisgurnus dabryanus]|uniref:semaphorin-7A n=1 Tax=Paramisgurnus dabryanus TaxID=90735 RepID=UPI0031F3CBF9
MKTRFSVNIKRYLVYRWLFCGVCFQCVFPKEPPNPRLTLEQGDNRLPYDRNYSHTVLFQESNYLFIGGINNVLQVDVDSGQKLLKTFTLSSEICAEKSCENVITVIERFQNCTFVCGTNGEKPTCWKLYPGENNTLTMEGTGISPHTCTKNSLSLVADGDLYAAAPLYSDGTLLQFRRRAGNRISLWMHDQWLSEPTFISSFLAKRNSDTMNEKIYVLFREKNSDTSPEADPWISRVARVCKVDEGGPKQYLQNIWTSFLKARLVCGIPNESLYFNRLQDVFVLHAEDWRESRVYALFSSSWNFTAVCIYSLEALDGVFEKSSFKDYNKEIPTPRPGTCVQNSKSIPMPTLHIIKDYPEMNDWIHPIHKDKPFFTSTDSYTKIAVDRVNASDGDVHNVLLLATDKGTILKVLEDDSKAFIISETHLTNGSAPIQSMKLDSERKKLFVGYPNQMAVFDLQRCQDYNASCWDCVLARDPYCAWSEDGCTSQTKGIQNIANGSTSECSRSLGRIKRDLCSPPLVSLRIQHTVPTDVPFYLSCPVESHHATYRWEHKDKNNTCQQTQSECLFLIPAMTTAHYGTYKCMSHERDYTKIVKEYELLPEPVYSTAVQRRAQEWISIFVTVVFYLCCL